jgi:hypothetical protein
LPEEDSSTVARLISSTTRVVRRILYRIRIMKKQ